MFKEQALKMMYYPTERYFGNMLCNGKSFAKAEIQQKPNYIYTEIGHLVEILHGDKEIISLPDIMQFAII